MKGDFTFCNPTRIHFGEHALSRLPEELARVGKTVAVVYGGGSIKKNGVYDEVMAIVRAAGKDVVEIPGVMPNPTIEKLLEGIDIARKHGVEFILAIGGGSVCDYAKALAVSIHCDADPWQKYFLDMEEPDCEIVPVGCILTLAGTGSEMNGGSVITNYAQKLKISHAFKNEAVFPRFSILNPRYTMSLPRYQMSAGIYDIFNHICEQYFSGDDDSTSDYIAEGLMRSLLAASRVAMRDPQDYEARSNIMWTASWALNTLISRGKSTDWMVHMIGKAIGAYTDATHGMTLSAVSMPYYRSIMPYGLHRFVRFAQNVWNVDPAHKSDEEIANEGLARMESWMRDLGLVMRVSELGVTPDMIDGIVEATILTKGGYHIPSKDDVRNVLLASM